MWRVVCAVVGHEWEKRPVKSAIRPSSVIGVCSRCGDEAYSHEAMSVGGRDVPGELLDQDDVDKIQAMYRDGEIDERELELGIGAALGDEEAAVKLKEETETCD